MSSQNSIVLLNRLLSLKESSAFQLILDSLSQSSYHLIQEFIHRVTATTPIIYLSYETINKPKYATSFLDCTSTTESDIIKFVQSNQDSLTKTLVIIDSLNYIPQEELSQFVARLANPNIVILSVFHTNCPVQDNNSKFVNYPSCINLLTYIASSIYEVEPLLLDQLTDEELDNKVMRLDFPVNVQLNTSVFKLTLTNRRKSGRALIYKFKVDSGRHEYEVLKLKSDQDEDVGGEDESLLKDLTTFNLTTSNKQKLAREQVELPYMQAQESLGASGGAIVYEFEKDDDYDEEDPYEDPF